MATSQGFRKPRGGEELKPYGLHPFATRGTSDDEKRREVHLSAASSREPAGIVRFVPVGQGGGLQTAVTSCLWKSIRERLENY